MTLLIEKLSAHIPNSQLFFLRCESECDNGDGDEEVMEISWPRWPGITFEN